MGSDFAVGEFTDAFFQVKLLFIQLEIQSASGVGRSAARQTRLAEPFIKTQRRVGSATVLFIMKYRDQEKKDDILAAIIAG